MDPHDYLRPDFDPKSRSVKISDLQNIFIDHGIRYNKAKTKADHIALFEEHIRPLAPRLLARAEKVRASSVGIEDRRLPEIVESDKPRGKKSLVPPQRPAGHPLPKSSGRPSAEPAEEITGSISQTRKAASLQSLASTVSSGRKASDGVLRDRKTRQSSIEPPRRLSRRSASVEITQEPDDEGRMDVDEGQTRSSRRASRTGATRKVSQSASARASAPIPIEEDDDEVDVLMRDNDEEPVSQPQQTSHTPSKVSTRPVVEIPILHKRKSEVESPQKRKVPELDVKSEAASGFSTFNPFQSSPDEEAKSKRRRKSSIGRKREASAEASPVKRSKTVSDLRHEAADHDAPTPAERDDHHSPMPPVLPDGLQRFRKRMSSTPDNLPSPVRTHLSPRGGSDSKPRPSFASLATAPEDFEVRAYISPRKVEARRSTPQEKAKAIVQEALAKPPIQQILDPDTEEEEEAISESQSDQLPLSQGDPVIAVSSSSSELRQIATPPHHRKQAVAQRRAPGPPSSSAVVHTSEHPKNAVRRSSWDIGRKSIRASGFASTLLLLALIWQSASVWADGKRALGFCDTGEDINEVVVRRQDESIALRHRNPELQNWQDYVDRARDFMAPLTCTPCPEQAICDGGRLIACSQGYIQQPSPLAALVFGRQIAVDATRSVLPLVFAPRCVPDTAYLHRVLEIASASSARLRHVKGDLMCSGQTSRRSREAKKLSIDGPKEAYVYGIPEMELKDFVRGHLEVGTAETDFQRKFTEALGYLSNHTEAIGATYDNTHWIAATAADMSLGCRARLTAYSIADEHKGLLSLITAILALLGYGQRSIKHRRAILEEVEELVPLSLSLLQAQDQNYNLRDSMTPVPYLAPAQLRDLVLRDERSPRRKAELWKQVEKAVESNSNVRARTAEQHGEEIRVWQWVGGVYETDLQAVEPQQQSGLASANTNRRRSYAALASRSSLSRPGTPRVSLGGNRRITWDEDELASPFSEGKQ